MMLMASIVHEPEAMQLHATELLMLLGTAIIMLVEPPAKEAAAEQGRRASRFSRRNSAAKGCVASIGS